MMCPATILSYLHNMGLSLNVVDGDKLKVRPATLLTDETR